MTTRPRPDREALRQRWIRGPGAAARERAYELLRSRASTMPFGESDDAWREALAGLPLADPEADRYDLRGLDLTGWDLRGAELTTAWLSGAILNDCMLDEAELHGATLFRAELRGSSAKGARFRSAHVGAAMLDGADLSGSDWSEARLVAASLAGARLVDARLSGCDLRLARLDRCDLVGADLRGAWTRGASRLGARVDADVDWLALDVDQWADYAPLSVLLRRGARPSTLLGLRITESSLTWIRYALRGSGTSTAVVRMLGETDWRMHLIAATAIVHGPIGGPIWERGWDTVLRSWVSPQLAVAALLTDPQFEIRAVGCLADPALHDPKLLGALAWLCSHGMEPTGALKDLLASPALAARIGSDEDDGAGIAERWCEGWRALAPEASRSRWVRRPGSA